MNGQKWLLYDIKTNITQIQLKAKAFDLWVSLLLEEPILLKEWFGVQKQKQKSIFYGLDSIVILLLLEMKGNYSLFHR